MKVLRQVVAAVVLLIEMWVVVVKFGNADVGQYVYYNHYVVGHVAAAVADNDAAVVAFHYCNNHDRHGNIRILLAYPDDDVYYNYDDHNHYFVTDDDVAAAVVVGMIVPTVVVAVDNTIELPILYPVVHNLYPSRIVVAVDKRTIDLIHCPHHHPLHSPHIVSYRMHIARKHFHNCPYLRY